LNKMCLSSTSLSTMNRQSIWAHTMICY
jgi:hypothetical protein